MKFVISALSAAAALTVAMLSLPTSALSDNPAKSITVYNAQHAGLGKEWTEAFTKETGIEVVLRNGSDSEMGNQIIAEGKNSPADVFLTENSPAIVLVDSAELLAPVDPDTLAQVLEEYR